MRKLIIPAFGCSLVFLIYIWIWISWHAWTSITKGQEFTTCNRATEKVVPLCSNCFIQKKEEFQSAAVVNPTGSHCLEISKLYGIVPHSTKYLTIGIPSVDRKKGKYLQKTLKSLVKNLDDEERGNVTIIVLIADSDGQLRSKRAKDTWLQFQNEINSGLILIIQAVMEFYPKIEITRRTFNDSLERIQWRSKQVTDFAFLFSCARDVGEYFLILEDDIETSPRYVTAIRRFILAKEGQDWVSLTFSGFFIIGRLLKNAVLKRLSDFLTMFYMEKPVDLLIMQFFDLLVQNKYIVTRRIPGIFQHIGLFSSLEGKVQRAKDRSFSSEADFGNPPADIVTTLGVYKKHFPEFCYISSKKFFWGSAPKANDTFDVILHRPIRLKKLLITSGNSLHKNDFIRYAQLKLSSAFQQMVTNNKANCTDFHAVAFFKDGVIDLKFNNVTSQSLIVQCIRIEFVKKQSNWILIKEIVVRGENN